MGDGLFIANPAENQELMRWLAPENRLEIWTGDRWVDLERDVLQPITAAAKPETKA